LPTNEETIINGIFQRINKNTARLTRQELRHARFGGQFITATEELTEQLFKLLPEGFPRIESQSKKQMKDVELVANILLSMETGIRGFSQDELDAAFSFRETTWDLATDIKTRFITSATLISAIARKPDGSPLQKSRFRNQADFYSLFIAIDQVLAAGQSCDAGVAADRLSQFVDKLEEDTANTASGTVGDYLSAARSNSNDTGPRKKRTEILLHVLSDTTNDYTSTDS
jgi:hypothetical protein